VKRRSAKLTSAAIIGSLALIALRSSAEPKDNAALKLDQEAINVEYLNTNFTKAEEKLKQALLLCKGNACSAKVRAQIHRDLGMVYIVGLKKAEEGKAQFVEALKADPAISLDQDLITTEIQAAFDEARKAAGVAAPAAAGEAPAEADGEDPETPDGPPAADGDLNHEPPVEQAVLTPVPVYVELPEGVTANKVSLRYKPFGSGGWKTIQMNRHKAGYAAEIPCLDVGSNTGNLAYYIQAMSAAGDLVGFSGTRTAPHHVPIKAELAGEPPNLPGKPPPSQCVDPADCPPGFPGCDEAARGGEAGEGGPFAANWISIGIQQDVLFLQSDTAACTGDNSYTCFQEDSDEFYAEIPFDGGGNEISGGPARATLRVMAGYDRIIGSNLGVGVRLGYAFGGGPKAPDGEKFLPFHAEGRVTYFFGTRPLARKGLRPFVHLSGGLAQVDAKVAVIAYQDEAAFQTDNQLKLDAWRKSGTSFIGIGGGLMYAITPATGPYLDVRGMQMLGVTGTSISPQLGYALGF